MLEKKISNAGGCPASESDRNDAESKRCTCESGFSPPVAGVRCCSARIPSQRSFDIYSLVATQDDGKLSTQMLLGENQASLGLKKTRYRGREPLKWNLKKKSSGLLAGKERWGPAINNDRWIVEKSYVESLVKSSVVTEAGGTAGLKPAKLQNRGGSSRKELR